MPIVYDAATVKTPRMTATRDAINSGTLEVLSGTGTVLLSYALAATAGTVSGTNPVILTLSGFPKNATAAADGRMTSARIRVSGADRITGMTVGMSAGAAWAPDTAYAAGDIRSNGTGANARVYRVTAGGAGTSAASGGPTGTGTAITDGTVTWEYLAPVGGDVVSDVVDVRSGQTVTVSSATIAHAA